MKSQPSTRLPILIVILVTLCLLAGVAAWIISAIPARAAEEFGPASSALTRQQKLQYSFLLFWRRSDLIEALQPGGEKRVFQVEMGETVTGISYRLEEEGFIRSGEAFRNYLIYAGLDTTLQAGEYLLSPDMSALEIAHQMQDATPQEISFVILPGWRAEEVAAALPTSGLAVQAEDFMYLVHHPDRLDLPEEIKGVSSLEGYLFPGEYRLARQANVEDLLLMVLEGFMENISPQMIEAYQVNGLSLHQAVILASIVQREAVIRDESPHIASVFYNRLEAGMRLESDPTVQYAIGYNSRQMTWWTNPLSLDDLAINSDYNTYNIPGLPAGPICNPGMFALKAAAYPEKTNDFFFRAACDQSGFHNFAQTYDEHVNNACP